MKDRDVLPEEFVEQIEKDGKHYFPELTVENGKRVFVGHPKK